MYKSVETFKKSADRISKIIDTGTEIGLLDSILLSKYRTLVEEAIWAYYCVSANKDLDHKPLTRQNHEGRAFYNSLKNEDLFLKDFFQDLEWCTSHFDNSEDGAQFLTLTYADYLFSLRDFSKKKLGIDILRNIEKIFPPVSDASKTYYREIANRLFMGPTGPQKSLDGWFEVEKCRPIFLEGVRFYEITLQSGKDAACKTDREIIFAANKLRSNYLYKLHIKVAEINLNGTDFPVDILSEKKETLRNHELNALRKIFGLPNASYAKTERDSLFTYMVNNGLTFTDISLLAEDEYDALKTIVSKGKNETPIFDMLDKAREIVLSNKICTNVIRYALFKPRNRWLRRVLIQPATLDGLGQTNLSTACFAFDSMPYCRHLPNHPVALRDLFRCIPATGRESELLCRRLKNSAENDRKVYCDVNKDLADYKDVSVLANAYNKRVYKRDIPMECIKIWHNKAFIQKYETNITKIFNELRKYSVASNPTLKSYIEGLIASSALIFNDDKKQTIVTNAYAHSRLLLLNGAAGTGKSTTISYLSKVFNGQKTLYLAQTYPALENMKERIGQIRNASFSVVDAFIKGANRKVKNGEQLDDYDLVCVDECSCVPDESMVQLLSFLDSSKCYLLLVGDPYQIESIKYGNWFRMSISEFDVCHQELTTPFRTDSDELKELWAAVREKDERAKSFVARSFLSSSFSDLYASQGSDGVILCLTYDGLYGVNQINKILQENNQQPEDQCAEIEAWKFKRGDPIIFLDSDRFKDYHFNNAKGVIKNIKKNEDGVIFTCLIRKTISPFESFLPFDNLTDENTPEGFSEIRFPVYKFGREDDPSSIDDSQKTAPFQLAYALTIHKAQGLEYKNVSVVVPDEVEEMVTSNIFYTAITRARKNLKIYASPSGMKNIMDRVMEDDDNSDFSIFEARRKAKEI